MEREIADLRRRLQVAEKAGGTETHQSANVFAQPVSALAAASASAPGMVPMIDRNGVANSLLDLHRSRSADVKQPNIAQMTHGAKSLGTTVVYLEQIDALFQEFFRYYHPFLPLLDPDKTPDQYFDLCPLLFWTVILVAARRNEDDPMMFTGLKDDHEKLVWSTIASVPQNYLVVKALAILCTWPLPTPSTSTDQTFILSGAMRQLALQTGLHRPSYVQDFSRNKVDLRDEDIQDRLKTWAICNIVSQNVSTAYGQPAETHYDFTLTTLPPPAEGSTAGLDAIYWPLQIERFVDKVSRKFYNNSSDPLGISGDQERATWISTLTEDYRVLEVHVLTHGSPIEALYLKAAGLHLRLSAFFDSITSPNYITDLLELYAATSTFLRAAFELETTEGAVLKYASRHIVMMILAAGFTLLKLLNSFFARHIDVPSAKALFSNTIRGIRTISIANNDLPARLAEVLAQLWHSYGAGLRPSAGLGGGHAPVPVDSSLQLRVRSRMSMSLIYDSVWRWREEFQFKGDGTTALLDSAVNNPTQPDMVSSAENGGSAVTSAYPSRHASGSLPSVHDAASNQTYLGPTTSNSNQPQSQQSLNPNPILLDPSGYTNTDASVPSAALNDSFIDHDYNLFDPLAFMLDAPATEWPPLGGTNMEDWDVDLSMGGGFG